MMSVLTDQSALLFVYGTLMRGGCRAQHLEGQRFVEEARTKPRYRMFDCGSYPALVEDVCGLSIHGELWQVSAERLQRLDVVEWVAEGLYERRTIRLQPPYAGDVVESYYYLGPTTGLRDCGPRWINNSD